MVKVGEYQQTAAYYNNAVNRKEKQQVASTEKTQSKGFVDKSKESTLSEQAQDVLEMLRSKYDNMDFMVADFSNGDEAKEILSRGTKEFSVLFSSDELEKMASDEKYLEQNMKKIENAVRMSDEINKKYGFESAFGKESTSDTTITRIGIAFNDDGTTSFFAELEKVNAKQRERIEQAKEEKREDKKAEEKKAEKDLQKYSRNREEIKRTTVQADSMEELLEKIGTIDWSAVKAETQPESGSRYDFSV